MALYTVSTGNTALAADLNQIVNLLNGSTTGVDVIVSSRIRAQLTGATAASGYVGGTTSGAPVSGTFAKGDFVVTQDGVLWVCTTAGSPGTWTRAGVVIDTTASDIQNLAATAAAGSSGKAADAKHVHSWSGLAVLANAQTFSALQTFSQGINVSGGSVTLPAASIADAALSSNIPRKNAAQTFSALQTFSAGLTVSGGSVTLPAASIADGALSSNIPLLNAANTFTQGQTFGGALAVPPSAGGTVASSNYGTLPIKITEQTPSSAGQVTFSSIPTGFRNLILRWKLRSTQAGVGSVNITVQFNSDSGAHYSYVNSQAFGSSPTSSSVDGTTSIVLGSVAAATAPANEFGIGELLIYDYNSATDFKNCLFKSFWRSATGTSGMEIYSGGSSWESTSALTRIDIFFGTAASGVVELWGEP